MKIKFLYGNLFICEEYYCFGATERFKMRIAIPTKKNKKRFILQNSKPFDKMLLICLKTNFKFISILTVHLPVC